MVTPESKPAKPLTTLRAGGVDADPRRVGRVAVGLLAVVLAVLVVVLSVAGLQKNARINQLRQHGVPATITVSSCSGLMGGSGSNLAGYACQGTFSVDGRRYSEVLPGGSFHRPGATVRGVVVPSDPGLMSTSAVLATEHPSWKVFILPVILFIVLALLVSVVAIRRGSKSSGNGPSGNGPSGNGAAGVGAR
jgi:hypothetical protein